MAPNKKKSREQKQPKPGRSKRSGGSREPRLPQRRSAVRSAGLWCHGPEGGQGGGGVVRHTTLREELTDCVLVKARSPMKGHPELVVQYR